MNKLDEELKKTSNCPEQFENSQEHWPAKASENTLSNIQNKKENDLTYLELAWRHEYVYKQQTPKKIRMIFYYVCKDKSIEDFKKDEELRQAQKETAKWSEDSHKLHESSLQDEQYQKEVSEKENYAACIKFTPKMMTLALSDQRFKVKNDTIKQYISGKWTQELKEFHDEIESISHDSTTDIDAESENDLENSSTPSRQTEKNPNQQQMSKIFDLQSFDSINRETDSPVCKNMALNNSQELNPMHNLNKSNTGFEQGIIETSESSKKYDKGKYIIDDNFALLILYQDLFQDVKYMMML